MRTVVFVAILFGVIISARSGTVAIASPDRAQTFAYGEMVWRQLSVHPGTRELTARITFSNLPYSGSPESRFDEAFDFRFLGTQVERGTGTVSVRDGHRKPITVARFRGDPANGWGDLTSEAKIYLLKESGCVTAILTATSEPRRGLRWIQMDDNWSLQNLIVRLCRAH